MRFCLCVFISFIALFTCVWHLFAVCLLSVLRRKFYMPCSPLAIYFANIYVTPNLQRLILLTQFTADYQAEFFPLNSPPITKPNFYSL